MLFTLISIAKSIQSLPKFRGIVSNVPFFLSEKSWDTAGNPPFSMILGQMCRFFGNYGFFGLNIHLSFVYNHSHTLE